MEFFSSDVERITGVQRLRLHNWIKAGFIVPGGSVAGGHGRRNSYTLNDVVRIDLLKRLIENGLHGRVAACLMGYDFDLLWRIHLGREDTNRPLQVGILVKEDGEFEPIENLVDFDNSENGVEENFGDIISNGFQNFGYEQAIIVNLSKIFDDIDAKL